VTAAIGRGFGLTALATLAASAVFASGIVAQDVTGSIQYQRGQIVSPAYEGWWPNDDGSFTLFFGYFNSNWEQQFDIPVGPENYFTLVDHGALDDLEREDFRQAVADQGQPTHFYPRRNPFLFTIHVPADFGEKEWVWTLKTQGQTIRAFGNLASDYRIDPQVISTEVGGNFGDLDDRLRTNIAPDLSVEGDERRSVRVGETLRLVSHADDPDDYPPRSSRRLPRTLDELYQPPSGVVVQGAPGLRMHWMVYRGPAEHVTFSPTQLKTWMDSRAYANSPWSPPYVLPEVPEDGKWETQVRFDRPGDYVLRAVASDGSMFSYRDVTVRVAPLAN
jgi:hypothetical protein